MRRARHAWIVGAVLVALAGCNKQHEVTAPPPPLRPVAEPAPPTAEVPQDCEPTPKELEAISFDERSIPEGARLADQARTELKNAESADIDKLTREQYISDAVTHLITALSADPYNVTATYNLAAAYARIGRTQCSLNLLSRLLQLRPHASKRNDVEAQLDRLLGRRQPLDPAFSDMRGDERFRSLIRKMCEGTSSATCVFGAERQR